MATPQMVTNDLEALQMLAQMASTLHDSAMAESELTGHSIPANSAIVFTAQQAKLIEETIDEVIEGMVATTQFRLNLT